MFAGRYKYLYLTGTSMAAPHVSGCCALLTEWWQTQTGQTPSPAMLKAILINTAEDMVGGPNASGGGAIANIPNNDQGWGRVSMENIFEQAPGSDRGPRIMLDQRNAFTVAGQEYMIRVAPVDPARAMRVTLVWSDAPGAAGANPALVNDLDLEVLETATGNTYLGNVNFVNGVSQPAAADPSDDLNNVECVYIENPNGTYEISVIAAVIARDARPPFDLVEPWQDFALVIDNAEVPPAAPISITPVIDRSGSMVSYGYVDVTRTASRQFIDLMGIDDRLGVVSFGTTAAVEYDDAGALKTITGAADRTDAKNAVDNIVFGGCTFMGDGIETAGNLLAPEVNDRAMVLLSDGYDNKGCDQGNAAKPSAVDASTALPAGMPIYSCAMGPSSDQALLEQLADITGGRYYFMPTIFDLFEIYNFIRGQITGDGVVSNESAFASKGSVTGCIEAGADYAIFTCAWDDAGLGYVPRDPSSQDEISVRLRNPKGRLIPANDAAVHRVVGDGYVIFRISEPPAGIWRIEVETARRSHTQFTAAIFARSGLEFQIDLDLGKFIVGAPIDFSVRVADAGVLVRPQKAVAQVVRPDLGLDAQLTRLANQLRRTQPVDAAIKDGVPDRIARLIALQRKDGDKLLKPIVQPLTLKPATRDPRNGITRVPDFSRFAAPQGAVGTMAGAVRGLAAAPGVVAVRQPTATFGTVIDRRVIDVRGLIGRGGFQVPTTPDYFRGQVANTSQAGSYNIAVTVTGVSPKTGSRFCRRDLVSVVIHPDG